MKDLKDERFLILWEIKKDLERFASSGNPSSCKKGCSFCCKLYKIKVTPQEASYIHSLKIKFDENKLIAQNKDWKTADKSCIFLKDDNCLLHDDGKPLSCITHNVFGGNEKCKEGFGQSIIRTKSAEERLKKLFNEYGAVNLHEEIFRLSNNE